MKNDVFLLIVAIQVATGGSVHGQGTLIAQHRGAADPTNEGFTLLRGGNPSLTPVMGDLGLNAWSVNLNSQGDIAVYSKTLTAQQQADAAASGWILSLTLRVLQPFNSPNYGIAGDFYTGTKYFSLLFGAESDGDPIVRVGGIEYDLDGAGSGYHTYQLRYDAGTGLASLWVDGSHLANTAGSLNPSTALFRWGCGQNPVGIINANWNEVSLTIVPEPSTLALVGLGGFFFVVHLLRRRRSRH
jgi:hypothetical protein